MLEEVGKTQYLNIHILRFRFRGDCLKKIAFVVIILFCIVLVSAFSDFDMILTKTIYSNNESFQGTLIINETDVALDEIISGDVFECGSYNEKEISLYNLLKNAGLYSGSLYEFTLGSSLSSYQKTFAANETKLVGLYVVDEIDLLNFSVSGSGGGFYIDVGADGSEEWYYHGKFINWGGSPIYPEEYKASYLLSAAADHDPQYGACNNVFVPFDELSDEISVKISAIAKRDVSQGKLIAQFNSDEDSKECELTNQIGSGWTNVSCNVTLDVSGLDNPAELYVCLDSTGSGYWVPESTPSGDYYFFNLRTAVYEENLSTNKISIFDSNLKRVMNDYTDDCSSEDCIIPLRLRMKSAGGLVLSDLILKYGPTQVYNFYNLYSEIARENLTDLSIPLNGFSDLRTPDLEEDNNCILKIEFDGSDEEVSFSVGQGPIPVIKVSSYYMGKDLPIEFDGGDSSAQDNGSIDTWKWNFGDNRSDYGKVVSHSYTNNGDYTVTLTVKDAEGIEASTNVVVHILPLADYLEGEFDRVSEFFSESRSFFNNLGGERKEFSDFMDYPVLINQSETAFNNLKTNFTLVSDSNYSRKDAKYAIIANDLHALVGSTPRDITKLGSRAVDGLSISNPNEVFSYGGVRNRTDFGAYADAVYAFNRDNVRVDMNSSLMYVKFFSGESSYAFIRKDVNVGGGSGNVIVEDLRNIVSNLDSVYGTGTKDTSTNVIYWPMDSVSKEIIYAVEVDSLTEIKTIVYSNVEVEVEDYCYFPSSGCQLYCGDGDCSYIGALGVDEADDLNENYCAKDCVRKTSLFKYILLFSVFILLVLYLLLYKGPGNFKSLLNKLSYGIFHKKLFVGERDKIILSNFIINSLRRGFTKEQIESALTKKGWNRGQINHILENYINKRKLI